MIRQILRRLAQVVKRRLLEGHERRVLRPRPALVAGVAADRRCRVAIIGAGNQGIAQAEAMAAIPGIELVGLAEIDPQRLTNAAERLGLPTTACFGDAAALLDQVTPLDLVSIATTAPSHVKLGRLALAAGVPRILLEKPIDSNLAEARDFVSSCAAAGCTLAVNYSRRWLLDYRAIRRIIRQGLIGQVRCVQVTIGGGELAMHGSHYLDLCRYLLAGEATWLVSFLEPVTTPNPRGAEFHDPAGLVLVYFDNGGRALVDCSSDLGRKSPFVVVTGDQGRITVDERRQCWTLVSASQREWQTPFTEPLTARNAFRRTVSAVLSDEPPAADGNDGVAALEMILAAHLSHRGGQCRIDLPLAAEQAAQVNVVFP